MGEIWGALGSAIAKLPALFNWVLRFCYKQKKVENRVVVDLAAYTSAVEAWLTDNGDLKVILRVANFLPFDLKIEKVTLVFSWDGINKKIYLGNYETVLANSEDKIFIGESLSKEEARSIVQANRNKRNEPRLSYRADFKNSLYSFQKSGEFRDFPLRLVNLEHAVLELEEAA